MILLVDDEFENRESLKLLLERQGWPCVLAASGEEAIPILREREDLKILITDLKMPGGMNGLELLKLARSLRPDIQRILVTAFGTVEDTVKAMKSGAFDVIPKPIKFKELKEKIRSLLSRAPEASELHAKNQMSPAFTSVLEKLRRAAQSEAHVLFLGESGTGKSYLASVLHQWSARAKKHFVSLNTAAIPKDLMESELFGFEKGAFTGANQSREGKILAADGGTLLLDEIGDLSLELQAKLLEFIQEKAFFKLGSNRKISADVRLLSATNRSLEELIKEKRFREDLLYRLKVVQIDIPPLRERKQDLLWLIPLLLTRICEKNKFPQIRLNQEAMRSLYLYNWPGNIRELENVLESSVVLAQPEERNEGFLGESALPEEFRGAHSSVEVPAIADLATLEKQAIEQALLLTGGNKKLSATLLGISERTLYRALKERAPQ